MPSDTLFSPVPFHWHQVTLEAEASSRNTHPGGSVQSTAPMSRPGLSPPGIRDGSSQMEAIPARMVTRPGGVAVTSSSHTQLLLEWEDLE